MIRAWTVPPSTAHSARAWRFAKATFSFRVCRPSSRWRPSSRISFPAGTVADAVKAKRFAATADLARLNEPDVISISVPTPLSKTKDPDVSYVLAATESVRRALRKGQLVVLESTTYPGTTRELMLPALESTGLKVGEDFFLAFSPERVDPGNERFNTRNTPKVVGGITPACL